MKDSSEALETSRPKKIALSIIFSIVVFSVFLFSIEMILRTTHLFGARMSWVIPDPLIGYRYKPGSEFWHFKENDHPITGKFNNYGWRDDDWSMEKPENTYRIAVLGDSIVEALQVESDRTFLSLTEQTVNQNHELKIDLMNFGRSGFTQTEELLVLQNDVEQFNPDMVILFFLPSNDIADISRKTAVDYTRPFYLVSEDGELRLDTSFADTRSFRISSILSRFKRHSALINLITERYKAYRMKSKVKNVPRTPLPQGFLYKNGTYLDLCTDRQSQGSLTNYSLNKLLIKEMSDFCKKRGIRFMLVTTNIPAYIPSNKTINPVFNPNFFEDDLRDYSASLDIEYMGLQSVFRKNYEANGQYLDWMEGRGHWNYLGHAVVAEALTKKLIGLIYADDKETLK